MKRILFIGFAVLTALYDMNGQGEHYIYPDDAGIIDVTRAPYFADSTGQTDATAAIQAALDAYPSGRRVIYLPKGIYLVSNTLKWPEGNPGSTDWKRTTLHGEGREYTTIKLKDLCEGFQDPDHPKGVIWTGPAPAQRFRNAIYDLTVNTGIGNRGASGIQFNCSNEGTIQRVRIISGDGQGVYGLDLAFTNEIGPGLIYDLEVEGFDVGVMHGNYINSMTFEKITLRNQNKTGFLNSANVCMIRGLVSENEVTAAWNKGGAACMILLDAFLASGADSLPAILNGGSLYGRNLKRTGYGTTLESSNGIPVVLDAFHISEFMSHEPIRLFPAPVTMLNLPVKDIPQIPWSDLSQWADPMDFGAAGDGTTDDTRAIQDAIDAGKETVYFPGGLKFRIDDTLFIRGDVTRIIGCEGRLEGNGTIVFDGGSRDTVILERIDGIYSGLNLIHRAGRTLVFNSATGIPVDSYGTGDFFLNNIVTRNLCFHQPGQHIWCRHINTESGDTVNVWNKGARLWLMGHKTERGNVKVKTSHGVETELLGAHNYSTSSEKVDPWMLVVDASLSVAGARETNYGGYTYGDYVMEIRGNDTLVLKKSDAPNGGAGGGKLIPVFCGYESGLPSPPALKNLQVRDSSLAYYLTWNEGDPSGLAFYNLYYAQGSGGPYTKITNDHHDTGYIYQPDAPGDYYFVVTQVDINSMESPHSNEVWITVPDYDRPAAPAGLQAGYDNGAVTLNWDPNPEYYVVCYNVYRAMAPGVAWIEIATGITDTVFVDSSLMEGMVYHYHVTALTIFDKESQPSTGVIIDPSTGMWPDAMALSNDRIYPNPAREVLTIKLHRSPDRSDYIEIFSAKGRKMSRYEGVQLDLLANSVHLPVQHLAPGIYSIRIVSEDSPPLNLKFLKY
jgi:hypothetical protein